MEDKDYPSTTYQDGPKSKRDFLLTCEQLTGEECREAISFMMHSADESVVKEKMKATFQCRQAMIRDQQASSTVLDVFPRFLDIPGFKNNIQRFYIIVDHKAIPCKGQTSMAAFDELFKAHFIFSVNYHEFLYSFYTFIQTTLFNIDIGSAKESPRVKELRAGLSAH
ncbi:hypothetical protein NQZ68_008593 [Dissostichus eleginoides]|nr:hypothetical protein NQZ68_008593 [Dissostichus eleginoides]